MTGALSPAVADRWYPVGHASVIRRAGEHRTVLLDTPLTLRWSEGGPTVEVTGMGRPLPVLERFGYAWTSLGEPAAPLFDIAETAEPDRRNLHAGSMGVRTSAPRAVENFLDMAHFSFVHEGILGSQERTEVEDYRVETLGERGLLATGCRFYQPRPVASSAEPAMVEYVYRVPHPVCAVLYKSSTVHPGRSDVVALFLQPVTEERIVAHLFLSMIDDGWTDAQLRAFQQKIFAQDKPILENQVPRRLPLDLRAEMPARADRLAIAYRRWLAGTGIDYGTIVAKYIRTL